MGRYDRLTDVLLNLLSPSTLGEFDVTLLKILIKTRKMVSRRVMWLGTVSGGMRKVTQGTIMKSSEGR